MPSKLVLLSFLLMSCSQSHLDGPPDPDPETRSDMFVTIQDGGILDTPQVDADFADTAVEPGAATRRCFADITLGELPGTRAQFTPHALLKHEEGWLAFYFASSTDTGFGTYESFISNDGGLLSTEDITVRGPRLGVARGGVLMWESFVLSWDRQGISLHEIGDRTLIERTQILPEAMDGLEIEYASLGNDGILRVLLWRTHPETLTYAALELNDDGDVTIQTAPFVVDVLGPSVVAAPARYRTLMTRQMGPDVWVFAVRDETGQGSYLVRAQIDQETWESAGVIDVLGVDEVHFPDSYIYDVMDNSSAVFLQRTTPSGQLTTEAVRLGEAEPTRVQLPRGERAVASFYQRGSEFGMRSDGVFRIYSPTFVQEQVVPSVLSTPTLGYWAADAFIELGSLRGSESADGLVAILRCTRLAE